MQKRRTGLGSRVARSAEKGEGLQEWPEERLLVVGVWLGLLTSWPAEGNDRLPARCPKRLLFPVRPQVAVGAGRRRSSSLP